MGVRAARASDEAPSPVSTQDDTQRIRAVTIARVGGPAAAGRRYRPITQAWLPLVVILGHKNVWQRRVRREPKATRLRGAQARRPVADNVPAGWSPVARVFAGEPLRLGNVLKGRPVVGAFRSAAGQRHDPKREIGRGRAGSDGKGLAPCRDERSLLALVARRSRAAAVEHILLSLVCVIGGPGGQGGGVGGGEGQRTQLQKKY